MLGYLSVALSPHGSPQRGCGITRSSQLTLSATEDMDVGDAEFFCYPKTEENLDNHTDCGVFYEQRLCEYRAGGLLCNCNKLTVLTNAESPPEDWACLQNGRYCDDEGATECTMGSLFTCTDGVLVKSHTCQQPCCAEPCEAIEP